MNILPGIGAQDAYKKRAHALPMDTGSVAYGKHWRTSCVVLVGLIVIVAAVIDGTVDRCVKCSTGGCSLFGATIVGSRERLLFLSAAPHMLPLEVVLSPLKYHPMMGCVVVDEGVGFTMLAARFFVAVNGCKLLHFVCAWPFGVASEYGRYTRRFLVMSSEKEVR